MTHVERRETVTLPSGKKKVVVVCDECAREAEARKKATERRFDR